MRTPPKLKKIAEQVQAYSHDARFKLWPAGRRSGKTEMAKRRIWEAGIESFDALTPWDDQRYFVAAPTNAHCKKIYWNDLKSYFDPSLVARIFETDLCIRLKSGCEIWAVGMDQPKRIEGLSWDGGVLDEYADMHPDVWPLSVVPCLSERWGWALLIGVPEGRNHYYDLNNRAIAMMAEADAINEGLDPADHVIPEWATFSWHSSLVLGEKRIAQARRDLSPQQFRQEYEASFESWAGRVYCEFDVQHNVRGCEDDGVSTLHIGMDFNVNPMCASISRKDGDNIYTFDEITLPNANTEKIAKEIYDRYQKPAQDRGLTRKIEIFPDPSGARRQTSAKAGVTDHSILRGKGAEYPWSFRVKAPKQAPAIRDRVNRVNSKFCNAAGERTAFIDPRCKELIACIDGQGYKPGTTEPEKGDGLNSIDHHPDAYGYKIMGLFPVHKFVMDASAMETNY